MPSILCAMRMPPNLDGHGGSQRAWRLLEALLPHGDVDFLLLYRTLDRDCVETPLDPIAPMVRTITRVPLDAWQPTLKRPLGLVPAKVCDLWRIRSHEAPQLARRHLAHIAELLPQRHYDLVFAARLPVAVMLDALMASGRLEADVRAIDFDDLMSKYRRRQVNFDSWMNATRRALVRLDANIIAHAERRIARTWDGASVCTDEDVALLASTGARAALAKVPNVVERERLPPRAPDGTFRILFVGNLGNAPNSEGLQRFVEQGWARLAAAVPSARLTLVGLNPFEAIQRLARDHGFELHANVPSLTPYYAACDVVIAPILFGSGTRIKILEAMAYGRPVVSTSMGAEGMGLEDGRHVLLADDMRSFADALAALATDRPRALAIAEAAHALQQRSYTPRALRVAVADWLERSRARALSHLPAGAPPAWISGRAARPRPERSASP
jgi:glycosyltransferase involved in cell wall biosynthesis